MTPRAAGAPGCRWSGAGGSAVAGARTAPGGAFPDYLNAPPMRVHLDGGGVLCRAAACRRSPPAALRAVEGRTNATAVALERRPGAGVPRSAPMRFGRDVLSRTLARRASLARAGAGGHARHAVARARCSAAWAGLAGRAGRRRGTRSATCCSCCRCCTRSSPCGRRCRWSCRWCRGGVAGVFFVALGLAAGRARRPGHRARRGAAGTRAGRHSARGLALADC